MFEVKLQNVYVIILSKKDFADLGKKDWVVGFAVSRENLIFIMDQK
jgi:hypothetical protein